MPVFYCSDCDKEMERELDPSDFEEAIYAMRSRRYVALLDELEKALPSDFIGFADDILKWAGKAR